MLVSQRWLVALGICGVFVASEACSGSDDDGSVVTEDQLASDPNLIVDPGSGVVVVFLEPPTSGGSQTGTPGVDVIPISYDARTRHTFCWEDASSAAMHYLTLSRDDGEEALRVDVNAGCGTETVEPGRYEVRLHHDGHSDATFPVFLANAETATGTTDGSPGPTFETKVMTNACEQCDLSGVDLSEKDLSGVSLSGADLSGANLMGANLDGADLSRSDLSNADLTNASIDDAVTTGACTGKVIGIDLGRGSSDC